MNVFYKEVNLTNLYAFKKEEVKDNIKLYELLLEKFPNGFNVKTDVYVNKQLIEIDNYDMTLKENDLITVNQFIEWNFVIQIAIAIVISMILAYLFKPKEPEVGKSLSVYSTKSSQIEAKLGEPIQIQYGRIRQYTKLIAPAYKVYYENEEYNIIHTCIGVGNFDIYDTYIAETNINSFINPLVAYFKSGVGAKTNHLFNLRDQAITLGLYPSFVNMISHRVREIENISFNETNDEIGYSVINAKNTQIQFVMINLEFPSGISQTVSDTDIMGVTTTSQEADTASFQLILKEIDDFDVETGFVINRTFSITKNTISPYRHTYHEKIKLGRYKVYLKRTDLIGDQSSKACNIQEILGMEAEEGLEYANDYSLISFVVKTSKEISGTAGITINIDCERKTDGSITYNTLLDFVKDIWTNTTYGMGESLTYLDIREQLDEEIGLVLDKKENAFDTLNSVLKSFGYMIYPYLNKFVIRKEKAQYYRKLIFSKKNCQEIQFSYKIQDDDEKVQGIKARYLKKGEINFENVYFPPVDNPDIVDYDETVLMGVNDEQKAKDIATFIYDKKRLTQKQCTIKTDLEGLIPEIGDRVGVSTEYIDDFITVEARDINANIITLKQKVNFKANVKYYVLIETVSNISYQIEPINIFTVETFTDTITLTNSAYVIEEMFFVSIGDRIEVIEDYLLTDIQPSEMNENLNKPTEVSLVLREYVENIYQ